MATRCAIRITNEFCNCCCNLFWSAVYVKEHKHTLPMQLKRKKIPSVNDFHFQPFWGLDPVLLGVFFMDTEDQ